MPSKKTDAKKKIDDEQEETADIKIPDGDEEEHPAELGDAEPATIGEDVDDHHDTPEVEVPESPDEVGFDDLTDDEREMLGLEAKPKHTSSGDDEEETGSSWEEFGYDEEELQ